jgi:hypothetical protein
MQIIAGFAAPTKLGHRNPIGGLLMVTADAGSDFLTEKKPVACDAPIGFLFFDPRVEERNPRVTGARIKTIKNLLDRDSSKRLIK